MNTPRFLPVISRLLAAASFAAASVSAAERTDTLRWTAEQFFAAGQSQAMILRDSGITLERNILIEDDAPACGYSSDPSSVEILSDGIVLKKTLILNELPAFGAWVMAMFYPDNPPLPNNGRHVLFTVNGTDIPCEVRHFWTHAPVPLGVLKRGENEILVRTMEPDARFKTWIALDKNFAIGSDTRLHHPNRSSRSSDGGKQWDDRHLGINGKADGEYSIRLNLEAYQPHGWIESPVIDLAERSNLDALQQPVTLLEAAVQVDASIPTGTSLLVQMRNGPGPSPEGRGWTGWKEVSGTIAGSDLKGRFFQFRLDVISDRPNLSPSIHGAQVRSTYRRLDPTLLTDYFSVASRRFPLIRSSFPFAYEDPSNVHLKRFRSTMHLDRIVGDARTEMEKMLRIKGWVARQLEWHLLRPDQDINAWDANKIMTPGPDGKVEGGPCLYYAIVLMQALQSFGFPARIVSADYSVWGGHEVVEVWSNDFGKWIFLDANFDTYFCDRSTGIPLNVLEMHNLLLREYFPGERLNRDFWSREDLVRRAKAHGELPEVLCVVGGNANSGRLTSYEWWNPPVDLSPYCGGYGPLVMGYLRYMPRSNYLSVPAPLPVNHGRTHWGWRGYYSWEDNQTPRSLEYSTFTSRPSDLYWNLNQIDFRASVKKRGVVEFGMVTQSPNLAAYEITINGRVKRTTAASFDVKLERGHNRVEMRVLDSMGNRGSVSAFECIYIPH